MEKEPNLLADEEGAKMVAFVVGGNIVYVYSNRPSSLQLCAYVAWNPGLC